MADLLFMGILLAFFALAVGLVRVCDRIIGPDDEWLDATMTATEAADDDTVVVAGR